jgi:hypothetical protein
MRRRNHLKGDIIEACECLKAWWRNSLIERRFGHFRKQKQIGGSEVISFNSRANGEVNAGPKFVHYTVKYIHFLHFRLYLPNAEITLDLEVNEVEVKVLTSLASVTAITVGSGVDSDYPALY